MLPNYVLYYAIEFWQKNKYSSECEVGIRETNGYCIDRRGELNGGGYFAVTWMQTKKVANNIYFTGVPTINFFSFFWRTVCSRRA